MVLLPLLWIAVPAGLAAQQDNLDRLRGVASILSDSLLAGYAPNDTICAFVVSHDGAWIMDQAIVSAAELRKLASRRCDGIGNGSTIVAITGLGVEYREVDDQDLLERDVSMEITATLPGTSAGARSVRAYALHAIDTVNSDRTSLLEASGYSFTKGIGPARAGGGFWKKIVEPAVVLAASAVIVVLLFTVRSQ
ncbi:MAG: hypothetical protein JWQ98_3608 [Chlorobi bacterium]|nr:hypothetical protein [Chlorobiota bacterium]